MGKFSRVGGLQFPYFMNFHKFQEVIIKKILQAIYVSEPVLTLFAENVI